MTGGPFAHTVLGQQTPVMATAGAYTSGDALGDLLTFQVGSKPDNGGTIYAVILVDLAKQLKAFNLVLFNRPFTVTADGSAFDPADANLTDWCIGHIPIAVGDWAAFNDSAVATAFKILPFNGDTLGRIYGQLVEMGGGTYATGDITVKLAVEMNS